MVVWLVVNDWQINGWFSDLISLSLGVQAYQMVQSVVKAGKKSGTCAAGQNAASTKKPKSHKTVLQQRSEESCPLFGPSVVHSNSRSLKLYRNCSHIFLLPWMTHPECLRRLEREKAVINHSLLRISLFGLFVSKNAPHSTCRIVSEIQWRFNCFSSKMKMLLWTSRSRFCSRLCKDCGQLHNWLISDAFHVDWLRTGLSETTFPCRALPCHVLWCESNLPVASHEIHIVINPWVH